MKNILATIKAPALIGFLLTLPFMFLEWINRRTFNESYPILLFAILWFLGFVFVYILIPIVREFHAGMRITEKPISISIRIASLMLIAWLWIVIVIDQMPCFLGIPTCD